MFDDFFEREAKVDIVKVQIGPQVFYLGSLSAEDFVEWQTLANVEDKEEKKKASALLIVNSLVQGPDDPESKMTPDERRAAEKRVATISSSDAREMVAKFRQVKISVSEKLVKAIMKLNGINQKDEATAKNV